MMMRASQRDISLLCDSDNFWGPVSALIDCDRHPFSDASTGINLSQLLLQAAPHLRPALCALALFLALSLFHLPPGALVQLLVALPFVSVGAHGDKAAAPK